MIIKNTKQNKKIKQFLKEKIYYEFNIRQMFELYRLFYKEEDLKNYNKKNKISKIEKFIEIFSSFYNKEKVKK